MRGKKVLFVINTLGKAGAEVAMLELLRRLDLRQADVSLYVLTGQGELVQEVPEGVHLCNTSYCAETVLSGAGRKQLRRSVLRASVTNHALLKNLPYLISNGIDMIKKGRVQADKLLWRILSDGAEELTEEYDLAVSYLEGGAAYYVAERVKAKKKAAFIHIDYNRAGYTRALDRDCYLKFDRIFTVSGEVKENFLSAYPECSEKTVVFHNMLNTEKILEKSREPGGFPDSFDGVRILTVGRLVYQKAYDLAIETMKLLKEDGYPVRWYVLGEGNLRSSLERRIEQLGLTEDFLLMGAVDNPYPWFAQADLYAHLTRFEGKSIAIQEAQILGKPIVASDCSGNREQIDSGVDGLLCELEPEKMRDAIERLLENRELAARFGAQASKRQVSYEEDLDMLLSL
jgi:glycosyltransferase involved in cell wall biosynthesis